MTAVIDRPLRQIFAQHRHLWDHDEIRPAVREAFSKVVDCGTEALGAEVYASEHEERVRYHTCKSRACPSCGYQANRAWQRDQWRDLPDMPYAHVVLTMPDVLWPFFRENRQLLHDLPVIGAEAIGQPARRKYGVQLIIMVVPHTFGRHLNFNCHLHILVSQGGLREDASSWRKNCHLDKNEIMSLWRFAVIELLRRSARAGVLRTHRTDADLSALLGSQLERPWIANIKRFGSKRQFIAYAGRYARRPPIAQRRFRKIGSQEIRFLTKDTRTKKDVETVYSPDEFINALANHVHDRYRHGVRYFGLLAPRVKTRTHGAVFALLGQPRLGKPARLRWAPSLLKTFGIDPLVDRQGQRMRWVRRLPPVNL